MFNTVQSLFTDLREWHQHMHVSLIQSNDVQELLDLSESAIGNPIVLVDLSFKLLAYTKNIKTDDEVYNEVVSRGYHTKQTIERLTNTRQVDSIKRASVIDIAFPLPQMTQYQTMTKTFFIKGVPYAYLRMICSAHAPSKSLEERFALLAESVEYYLHNHYSAGSINKYMYEYVLVELIENKIKDEEDIEERIKCVGPSAGRRISAFEDHFRRRGQYFPELHAGPAAGDLSGIPAVHLRRLHHDPDEP